MNILFIHQNFPGQFKHLAPALAAIPGNKVLALTITAKGPSHYHGVEMVRYALKRGTTKDVHPWVSDIETKVIRGEACFHAALALKERGFTPDVIIAHHGWGESLFSLAPTIPRSHDPSWERVANRCLGGIPTKDRGNELNL